jgi:hypothetical protein
MGLLCAQTFAEVSCGPRPFELQMLGFRAHTNCATSELEIENNRSFIMDVDTTSQCEKADVT